MDTLLTTKQVQDLLKVDRITIYRMLQDGRLKGVKIGQQWRFYQGDVERLLGGDGMLYENDSESNFPTHCVQTIQNLFSSVTQISSLVVDSTGEPVTQISEPCSFCKLIQTSESGRAACKSSWKDFAQQSKAKKEQFVCHAGLNYFGSLIIDQNKAQGLFLAGEFYFEETDPVKEKQHYQNLAKEHGLNANALIEAASHIPRLNAEQQSHLMSQPQAAARAVESILTERNTFLNRLQKIASLTQNI
ncbi:MAG: PocR ligand-binding domain-containing protein [Anaerolineaceae bacterium]|jgi:excisionase family DNA binding protein